MKHTQRLSRSFSLVEIVIALGVIALVISGIMGLIPASLKAFRNSNEQSGGANLLNALADSVRGAETADGINFSWIYNGVTNIYVISGPTVTSRWEGSNSLTVQGLGTPTLLDKQLLAVVVVTPPSTLQKEGSALISVAWPASSGALWNSSSQQWSHADGSATIGIRFLPRRSPP